jgi:protocatechuate 3,4-dioxygenase beta subunit
VRFPGEAPTEPQRSGYAPTYYPGTPNGNEAQRVAVALGQEITSADFGLAPVRLARISGVVIGSDGRPVEGTIVSATPRTNSAGAVVFPTAGGSSRTDANGNFTLNGIAPGEYTLNARGERARNGRRAEQRRRGSRHVHHDPGDDDGRW